jgi:hypothetical protein
MTAVLRFLVGACAIVAVACLTLWWVGWSSKPQFTWKDAAYTCKESLDYCIERLEECPLPKATRGNPGGEESE